MSLLQQNSQQLDDAAKGESFTKGSSHVVWASIAAIVVVTAIVAAYIIAGQKPPPATGQIVAVWAWPHHAESSGIDASGAQMAKESFDQMLIFADVKIHDQGKVPLYLNSIMTNVTLPDGIHSSYAALPAEYDRIFMAYGNIPVPHGPALPFDTLINPGQTIEGTMVASFRLDKQQWDARKALDFTFGFRYQPILKLTPQTAVIEY
ncbi:MAG: hypothetical protein ACRD3N_11990 [Terracidiphilus sp.]